MVLMFFVLVSLTGQAFSSLLTKRISSSIPNSKSHLNEKL